MSLIQTSDVKEQREYSERWSDINIRLIVHDIPFFHFNFHVAKNARYVKNARVEPYLILYFINIK